MFQVPAFWKSDLGTVERLAQMCGAREFGRSAGGRALFAFAFGERQVRAGSANYSSACGAHDKKAYLSQPSRTLLLIGGEHGQETEGIAALTALISLLHSGSDFVGGENPALLSAARQMRVVIVPVANPDGRARVQPASMLGGLQDDLSYWGMGTHKDGTLYRWPQCKFVHPMRDDVGFLGGYYNDDGINLMHDNFFHPMARETQALLDLAEEEKPAIALHLHGGTNSIADLLQTAYVPRESGEAIRRLALRCDAAARQEGLYFTVRDVPEKESGDTPPSFNLPSAMHHVCGCVSAVFESNEHICDQPGEKQNHAQVMRSHMILFEQAMRMILEGDC